MKLTHFALIALTLLIGVLHSSNKLDAQETPASNAGHSSTQEGVTVQIEKVTVDRILNTSAWLKAKEEESKRGKEVVESLRQHLPARLVAFSLSVVGETKGLGPTRMDFVDGKQTLSSTDKFFSSTKWKTHLRDLKIDPNAKGIETRILLDGKTKLSAIFPARLEVQVTKSDGKELTFVFENIEF